MDDSTSHPQGRVLWAVCTQCGVQFKPCECDRPHYHHYVFYCDAVLIGTIMTQRLSPEKVTLRLIAIDLGFREKGYGGEMMFRIEGLLRKQGFQKTATHATLPAMPFYRRHGDSEMVFLKKTSTTQLISTWARRCK